MLCGEWCCGSCAALLYSITRGAEKVFVLEPTKKVFLVPLLHYFVDVAEQNIKGRKARDREHREEASEWRK